MVGKKKILIADDEPDILEILRFNLEAEGYEVTTVKNGIEAIEISKKISPDLIILDMMMPGKSGLQVCEDLRLLPSFKNTVIIFLTAINDDDTEVKSLRSGADDYLVKPIRPMVLVSKVNALFRRIPTPLASDNQSDELTIDREQYKVTYRGSDIILARKEFELLSLLASSPGKVFLRNDILQKIWGTDVIVGDRTIDVHIRKLREKLGDEYFKTVKGVGYKFEF